MFRLPETDRIKAEAGASRTFAAEADIVLSDRPSTSEKKEGAIPAVMSIEWAPGLSREVGPCPINKHLKR